MTLILGIETSCDETAAAVVEDGRLIRSNVVASQIDIHRRYGGVFPEVASRQHVLSIMTVVSQAMEQAQVRWYDLDAVAVTYGPGLAGSLLVGVNVAKGIAWARGLPLLGINHLEGHIYANWLVPPGSTDEPPASLPSLPPFPHLCLVVSGGHTDLILMTGHGHYRLLGRTLDDAAGEAFDKVGRLLGLEYPGGPAIERSAEQGSPEAFDLPRAWLKDSYDFSFSGLKTAVLRIVEKYGDRVSSPLPDRKPRVVTSKAPPVIRQVPVANLAASFQASIVEVLVKKTQLAATEYKANAVLLSGGVAANTTLRRTIAEELDIPVLCPPLFLCTDNAAMIASAGYFRYRAGYRSGWDLDVVPRLGIVSEKARAQS